MTDLLDRAHPIPVTGCWLWAGASNAKGYGKLADGRGGWVLAHRAAYALCHGGIPEGMEVCHRCDTPACINPAHLFVADHAGNMADMARKGRSADMAGTKNPRAKLTPAQVLEIRASKGHPESIGAAYGVTGALVRRIRQRLAWAHL